MAGNKLQAEDIQKVGGLLTGWNSLAGEMLAHLRHLATVDPTALLDPTGPIAVMREDLKVWEVWIKEASANHQKYLEQLHQRYQAAPAPTS